MKKRMLSILLGVAMTVSMLAGCGSTGGDDGVSRSSGDSSVSTDQTESDSGEEESAVEQGEFDWKAHDGITLQVMFNQHTYAEAIVGKLADFEALTGIKVEYSITPEENYFDKLTTSLNSRSGTPDVFMTGAYQVWEYAPAGYLEPLEGYINDAGKTAEDYDFGDFYESVVGSLQWDLIAGHPVGEGSQWALPMGYELNNLAYNKSVFEEKGIEVPGTADELLEATKALQEFDGSGTYGIALRGTRNWATIHPGYMSLFATWGAQDFAVEDGRLVCKLDSKEAIEMTEYWVELIKNGSTSQWSTYTWYQAGADLGAKKAAMLFDATCNGYFQNVEGASAEAGNIAWTGIPMPEGKTEAKSNIWVWSLGMNADSVNKDAAWYFIQYFTNKDFMQFSGTDGSCADTPRKSVAESDEYIAIVGKADGYLEALDELLPGATIQFTPQPYFFECTTEWASTLQELVAGGKYGSVEEGMKALTDKLNKTVADIPVE